VSQNEWLMRIENGLEAHFKEPNGGSRPGVDWAIDMKNGEKVYRVRVRALLADDASARTRKDEKYQARTAMQYLDSLLTEGWHPDEERLHTIYIGNPKESFADAEAAESTKPWWKFW
jgi:hypothetical protein